VTFNRKTYFDGVRLSLFAGNLSQQQVDGQNSILDVWEGIPVKFPDAKLDLRWLAYMLATAFHETAQAMQPVEEFGKGAGMSYGAPDPETGQAYYGRGYVQLTWRDNYHKATVELGLKGDDDLEWNADKALDSIVAAEVMYKGMYEGWFRPPNNLPKYFNATTDDPYGAREIINGDKSLTPSWSGGVSIGKLIEGYHDKFYGALDDAWGKTPAPPPDQTPTVAITITGAVKVTVNGQAVS
jgi:putative chitinase